MAALSASRPEDRPGLGRARPHPIDGYSERHEQEGEQGARRVPHRRPAGAPAGGGRAPAQAAGRRGGGGPPQGQADEQGALRARAVPTAGRAGRDAGVGPHHRRATRGHLRGPRRRRQGRHDPADLPVPEPARRAHRRPAGAHRARAVAVVLPALRPAPAGRRGDRPVRPLLVQPCRRRAGHGLLQRRRVPPLPAPGPDLRADARRGRDPAAQVLVQRLRRGAGGALPLTPG